MDNFLFYLLTRPEQKIQNTHPSREPATSRAGAIAGQGLFLGLYWFSVRILIFGVCFFLVLLDVIIHS